MGKITFAFLIILVLTQAVWAQTETGTTTARMAEATMVEARIKGAKGTRFIHIRGETAKSYDILLDDTTGIDIISGDSLVTDASTFLEIEFDSVSGAEAVLSENSQLTFSAYDSDGNYVVKIEYGRVRIRSSLPLEGRSIWVKGPELLAYWSGGDFGYDVFYNRNEAETRYATSIYSFDGRVEVFQQASNGESKVYDLSSEGKLIVANKMLRADTDKEWEGIIANMPIEPEVLAFWSRNEVLTDRSIIVEPEPVLEKVPVEEKLTVSEDLNLPSARKRASSATGKVMFTVGVVSMITGAVMRALVPDSPTSSVWMDGVLIGGASLTTAGIGVLVYSSILK